MATAKRVSIDAVAAELAQAICGNDKWMTDCRAYEQGYRTVYQIADSTPGFSPSMVRQAIRRNLSQYEWVKIGGGNGAPKLGYRLKKRS
jgi:hypothetical protein